MSKRVLAMLGIGLAGSQAGHLLAYQVRFGAMAGDIQSSGAHAYFPVLAKTATGLVGLGLITALLMIGVSRMVRSRPGVRPAGAPAYLSVLACLFTLQLALFMTQETVESAVAGARLDATVDLLLWGIAGQLPVAVVGAAALRWLWSRVEVAAEALVEVIRIAPPSPVVSSVLAIGVVYDDFALLRSHAARSRIAKRGPPDSSF